MINPLDAIPSYLKQAVQNIIGSGANGDTLIVDDSKGEVLLMYSGFTRALKREYENACEERGADSIKIYQINRESSGVRVTRYSSAKGMNVEKIWGESVQ